MISVFTTCYKDGKAFELFCQNMVSLEPRPRVYAMGYDYDECHDIAKRYGVTYLTTTHNLPLGKKNNDCIETVLTLDDSDRFMYMGADNLISQSLWTKCVQSEADLFGVLDIYFYQNGRFYYFGGYKKPRAVNKLDRTGEPIGPCKVIHRKLLKNTPRPWRDDKTRSTDYDMWHKLLQQKPVVELFRCELLGGLVDIKSGVDLTPLSSLGVVEVDSSRIDQGLLKLFDTW